VENYLHKLYILEQRFWSYLKTIERIYKNSQLHFEVDSTTKKLGVLVTKAFTGYCKVRGSYVHQIRYTDNDLDRLRLFNTLSKRQTEKSFKAFDSLNKEAYEDIRRKWKQRITHDIKGIYKLNQVYFGFLYETITKNGRFVIPREE
jgi:hypothetical protein